MPCRDIIRGDLRPKFPPAFRGVLRVNSATLSETIVIAAPREAIALSNSRVGINLHLLDTVSDPAIGGSDAADIDAKACIAAAPPVLTRQSCAKTGLGLEP